MNKSGIIKKISKKLTYFSKQDIEEGLSHILDLISVSLQNKDRVELRGFGSFSSRIRKSRIARNPKTGEVINIDSKSYPYFRASKKLKSDINK